MDNLAIFIHPTLYNLDKNKWLATNSSWWWPSK